MTWPEFIHIPRTGGSTVESVSKDFELWGAKHPALAGVNQNIGIGKCFRQHVPPSMLPAVYTGRETFCIVRDVHSRIVSEFGFQAMHMSEKWGCSAAELNRFVHESFSENQSANMYRHDCHFLPQAAYVYSWDARHEVVDYSRRQCSHVIHSNWMREDLNEFWKGYGYPLRLENQRDFSTSTKGDCSLLRASNLTEAARALIASVYEGDLKIVEEERARAEERHLARERERLSAPALPERVLVSDEQQVENKTVIAEDLATGMDFEVSFDITPYSLNQRFTSILRFTSTKTHVGHPGDRMPAITFMPNSTRLFLYMGHADNHNANCRAAGPGLELGRAARVSARLSGTSFRVQVDGREACTIGGYNRKYDAMKGVRVYMGDNFDLAADAVVANLVYKVEQ